LATYIKTKFYVLIHDDHQIIVRCYEYENESTLRMVSINETNIVNILNLRNVCLTHIKNYIVAIIDNSITYFDIFTNKMVIKHDWPKTSSINQILSVFKTDDVLFIEHTNDLKHLYMVYSEVIIDNEKKICLNFYKRRLYSRDFKFLKNTLCFNVENYVLQVFNTNDIKFKKTFDGNFKLNCNALTINSCISQDENYLATHKLTSLKLYRLNDAKEIANITLHREIRTIIVNSDYLITILDSNELISFMIATDETALEKIYMLDRKEYVF
jgi:hypothetical protein